MSFRTDPLDTGRDFFFTPAGNNTFSGKSDVVPVADPQTAIARVNALTVPPAADAPASINASVSGTYDKGIVIPQFTTANCDSASIISTDAVLVEAAGRHTIKFGSLFAQSEGATCFKINGKKRVRAVVNSCVVPKNGLGFDVSGNCEEVFVDLVEGVILGDGGTLFNHTATSPTPIVYEVGNSLFSDINQTFMKHNPGVGSVETIVNISAAQPIPGAIPATTAGSMIIMALAGSLVVNAGVLVAVCSTTVSDGALVVYDVQALIGSTIVEGGGTAVYKSLGRLELDVDLQGGGAIAQIQTESFAGNFTVRSGDNATLKTDVVIGNITVEPGGRLFLVADTHIGTITPSDPGDPRINGISNGVRRGSWRVLDEIALIGADATIQAAVATGVPIQVTFGPPQLGPIVDLDINGNITCNVIAQLHFLFELQTSRTNAGGFVDLHFRVLVDGVQFGEDKSVRLDGVNDDVPIDMHTDPIDLVVGQVVTLEMLRSATGFNDGSLMVKDPTLAGWTPSPSALVTVTRTK